MKNQKLEKYIGKQYNLNTLNVRSRATIQNTRMQPSNENAATKTGNAGD